MALLKSSQQWTDEQRAWLQARAARLGLQSIAAVARMLVQAEIEREACEVLAERCPTCGQEWQR